MKNLFFLSFFTLLALPSSYVVSQTCMPLSCQPTYCTTSRPSVSCDTSCEPLCITEKACDPCSWFSGALTAGYVFKHSDSYFRDVYGYGMGNIITADGAYNFWRSWGIGAKVSYWLAVGKTTAFSRHTFLQEVPVTFYLRKIFTLKSFLQLYVSLGGGFVWIKEKSYLGNPSIFRGIGEVEVGLNYPCWNCVQFTSAFRYLFPRQKHGNTTIDVGGFDLRAGIGFAF